jgi:hypothetical protein
MGRWRPLKEGLTRLLPARKPDHRDDDGRAVDPQHHKRRDLQRGRHVERDLGEVERPDHRNQEDEPDREDNR